MGFVSISLNFGHRYTFRLRKNTLVGFCKKQKLLVIFQHILCLSIYQKITIPVFRIFENFFFKFG
jgi:hypothetical protein